MEEINQNTQPLFENDPTQGLNLEITYEYASTGKRFLNYLIDYLFMYFGLSFVTGAFVGLVGGLLFPEYMLRITSSADSVDLLPITYAIVLFNHLFYYTICEKAFRGYTLGKLITGTRVIREDGGELTFKNALLRSLSRLVPFEAFSAFGGYPWHDSWTKTRVIKAR
jgi:uncharacterized RDD family membrane protein YckC